MDTANKDNKIKEESNNKILNFSENDDYLKTCPTSDQPTILECSTLHHPCIICERDIDCIYGALDNYTCTVRPKIVCNVNILCIISSIYLQISYTA